MGEPITGGKMTSKIEPRVFKYGNRHILYDAGRIAKPSDDIFDPQELRERGQMIGQALGRGEAYFFRHDTGELVLRHYRRGGFVARFLRDFYAGFRPEATRSWREWRLLATLYDRGLSVPMPVAARASLNAGFYRADLITARILNSRTLTDRLKDSSLADEVWRSVGRCIRSFHDENVYHADLNANNILLDDQDRVFLIDFDRGGFKSNGPWKRSNLARLERSLNKIAHQTTGFHFTAEGWRCLLQGYGPASE